MNCEESVDHIRRVFVTVASTEIGAAIAARLGREGYEIVLAGRNRQGLQEVRAQIEPEGGQACIVKIDLSEPSSQVVK